MSDDAEVHGVSCAITNLREGEVPYLTVMVPLRQGDKMAERILGLMFGNDEQIAAARERFIEMAKEDEQ